MKKVLIVLVLAHLLSSGAHAQSVKVSLSPKTTEIYAKPGTSVIIPVSIKNLGEPATFRFSAVSLLTKDDEGRLSPVTSFPSGISASIPETEAQFFGTGQERKTEMTIKISPGVTEKDYYLGFMLEHVGKKRSEGKSSIALAIRPISTVLLTVTRNGVLQNSGYIKSITVGEKSNVYFFDSTDVIPISLTLANSGNNWMYMSGAMQITNMLGKHEYLPYSGQRVLAGSSRVIPFSLSGFHLGKYTVTVNARKTTFVAFPFKLVLALLGLLGITLLAVVRLNHPRIQYHPPKRL